MEIGQVGPVLRHCLRHSRGDNRVGFPGSEWSQACGDDRGRSAGDHRLVSTGLVRVPFRFCEQAPIWRDARSCPRIARRRSGWVGLRVDCSDLAIELGGCPHRGYPGLEPDCPAPTFTVLGICGGILVLAFQRDQNPARVGAISGSLIGVFAGIGAWLALIGALNLMSKTPMEWGQSHDEHDRFGGDDHGPGLQIERRRR